jgi:hypothetical protein
MKYLLILLLTSSCWAFIGTGGEDKCRFTEAMECGRVRLIKIEGK